MSYTYDEDFPEIDPGGDSLEDFMLGDLAAKPRKKKTRKAPRARRLPKARRTSRARKAPGARKALLKKASRVLKKARKKGPQALKRAKKVVQKALRQQTKRRGLKKVAKKRAVQLAKFKRVPKAKRKRLWKKLKPKTRKQLQQTALRRRTVRRKKLSERLLRTRSKKVAKKRLKNLGRKVGLPINEKVAEKILEEPRVVKDLLDRGGVSLPPEIGTELERPEYQGKVPDIEEIPQDMLPEDLAPEEDEIPPDMTEEPEEGEEEEEEEYSEEDEAAAAEEAEEEEAEEEEPEEDEEYEDDSDEGDEEEDDYDEEEEDEEEYAGVEPRSGSGIVDDMAGLSSALPMDPRILMRRRMMREMIRRRRLMERLQRRRLAAPTLGDLAKKKGKKRKDPVPQEWRELTPVPKGLPVIKTTQPPKKKPPRLPKETKPVDPIGSGGVAPGAPASKTIPWTWLAAGVGLLYFAAKPQRR